MPTLTLFLKGSLVLFAKKGQPTGKVAILKNPPPRHVLKISYRVKPPGGTFGSPIVLSPVSDNMGLQVTNPVQENITLRGENAPIVRTASPTHQDSFEWFVDLENEEVYGNTIGAIGANKAKFKEILTFKSGELFSGSPLGSGLSYNRLHRQKGSEAEYTEFGFVAGSFGVLFSADRFISSGTNPVFDSSTFAAGSEFRIELEMDATPNSVIVADANHYYKAVGAGIPPDERHLFASIVGRNALKVETEHQLLVFLQDAEAKGDKATVAALQKLLPLTPPAGPEAACFPAYMSRSDLP
jgi:hypothetical protein